MNRSLLLSAGLLKITSYNSHGNHLYTLSTLFPLSSHLTSPSYQSNLHNHAHPTPVL